MRGESRSRQWYKSHTFGMKLRANLTYLERITGNCDDLWHWVIAEAEGSRSKQLKRLQSHWIASNWGDEKVMRIIKWITLSYLIRFPFESTHSLLRYLPFAKMQCLRRFNVTKGERVGASPRLNLRTLKRINKISYKFVEAYFARDKWSLAREKKSEGASP